MKPMPDFSSYYANGYEQNTYGKGLMPFCMRQSHRLIEKKFTKNDYFENIIEIGAGAGYHLKYIRHEYGTYTMADVNESVIQKLHTMNLPQNVKIQMLNGGGVKEFPDNSFDRLIALNVLEHIIHPEEILREWYRMVKRGGIISLLLPCDPGAAWRFGRLCQARGRAQKNGMAEYDLFMALEHVNAINGLMAIIRYGFDQREEMFWPFPIPSMDLNLFYGVHIVKE